MSTAIIFLEVIMAPTAGVCYHQYDNMAYPDVPNNIMKTVFKTASIAECRHDSVDSCLVVPDHASMQSEALGVYLDCYKNKLCSLEEISLDCKIERIYHKIVTIYSMLSNSEICSSDESIRGPWRSRWLCPELQMVSDLSLLWHMAVN